MSAAGGASDRAAGWRARLRGLVVAAYVVTSSVFFVLLQLPVMLVTFRGDFSIWLARHLWAPAGLWLAGVRLRVPLPRPLPDGPAIYVSNHGSALDIWILFRVVTRNVRFIAKEELFRIPIFGWYLRMARFIAVDRRDHARAVASLRRGSAIIRGGISVVAFPEGTRSADGHVRPFKKGPFVLALEAGVPVVPIAIAGAAELNPKGRLAAVPGEVRVGIGEPVDPRRYPDRNDLLREVRRRIIELHRAMGGRGGDVEDAVAAQGLEGVGR